jgi:predicted TIM-barrel fold metal-dependent hydrolase
MSIMNGLANLVANHPQTTFMARMSVVNRESQTGGQLLDRCPNFYVDISARISELGRQPYSARRFFIHYADRILFGSDMGPDLEYYRLMYRFLETDDEYFNYGLSEIPDQGRWYIYGLYLPDAVLEKVYCRNAERVILKRAY